MSRLLIVMALVVLSCNRAPRDHERFGGASTPIHGATILLGDDVRFASPHFVTPATRRSLYDLPRPPATFWIRSNVTVDASDELRPLGLYVSVVAATEVYWDGVLVGRGGTIGADGRVIATGPIDQLFAITGPARNAGQHLIAIRVASPASAARLTNSFGGLATGDYETMLRNRLVSLLLPFASLGMFIVIGGYSFARWLAGRRELPPLVLALLCFAASLLVLAESYRPLFGYTSQRHLLRLEAVATLTAAVAFLLPLFLMFELGVARRWSIAVAIALAACWPIASFDQRCAAMFAAGIIASCVTAAVAFRRGRRDYATFGGVMILAVALALTGEGFGDRAFFIAFAAFLIAVLGSTTLEQRRERRQRDLATLQAARFEIELLKRSIQPHFLMNSLTAVMEWIEQEPAKGVRFLEALAGELRILSEISSQPLITMAAEVELCEKHLTIMSCRTGMSFDLVVDRVDRTSSMPPAIFHTLLENAISHNRYREGRIVFHLSETQDGSRRTYVLDTPRTRTDAANREEGVGLRYVKTRLEETFPGRWRLWSDALERTWRTTIEVPL
jgi:hypothetical protein